MTKVSKDWRDELVESHAALFGPPCTASGYPECGEGWREILEMACARMARALTDHDRIAVEQIKEKYGTLRIYWSGTVSGVIRTRIEEALALATARSACTCEVCGHEGRLHCSGIRLSTLCTPMRRESRCPCGPSSRIFTSCTPQARTAAQSLAADTFEPPTPSRTSILGRSELADHLLVHANSIFGTTKIHDNEHGRFSLERSDLNVTMMPGRSRQ